MDTQTHQAPGETRRTRENKYLLLLLSLVAVALLIPIHHELKLAKLVSGRSYLLAILFVVVMIFGVRAVSGHGLIRLVGTGLWITALIAYAVGTTAFEQDSTADRVAGSITIALLFAGLVLLMLLIFVDLFRGEAGVTSDRLRGAACAYLLMGMAWALAYYMILTWFSGSFQLGEGLQRLQEELQKTAETTPRPTESKIELAHMTYFSFVTLTTLGYGDMTPVRPLAATVAWLEAFAGQFYLTVLVAFLVGKRLATWAAGRS